jgi:hypothetical protein
VKPWLVAIAMIARLAPAPAPSLLVTPGTARAASSAASARALSISGASFAPSSRSSSGGWPCISRSCGARPAHLSSGASRAIAIARSTSASSDSLLRSEVDTLAERCPTKTRSPSSSLSERSTSSSAPIRTDTDSERSAANTASEASAPAARARSTMSRARSQAWDSVSIAAT